MEKLRLIVLSDMPCSTRHERKLAHDLERELFKNGFTQLQAGVYTRMVDGRSIIASYRAKLSGLELGEGVARFFSLTERQFQDAELLSGKESVQESEIGSQLDVFL